MNVLKPFSPVLSVARLSVRSVVWQQRILTPPYPPLTHLAWGFSLVWLGLGMKLWWGRATERIMTCHDSLHVVRCECRTTHYWIRIFPPLATTHTQPQVSLSDTVTISWTYCQNYDSVTVDIVSTLKQCHYDWQYKYSGQALVCCHRECQILVARPCTIPSSSTTLIL